MSPRTRSKRTRSYRNDSNKKHQKRIHSNRDHSNRNNSKSFSNGKLDFPRSRFSGIENIFVKLVYKPATQSASACIVLHAVESTCVVRRSALPIASISAKGLRANCFSN